jgi:hypothetical protein
VWIPSEWIKLRRRHTSTLLWGMGVDKHTSEHKTMCHITAQRNTCLHDTAQAFHRQPKRFNTTPVSKPRQDCSLGALWPKDPSQTVPLAVHPILQYLEKGAIPTRHVRH